VNALSDEFEFVTAHADFDSFYRAEVLGQVRRAALLVGSDDAANDIVQDAFANMYRRWKEIDDPAPYLNRAVLNGCRDRARRGQRLIRLGDRLRIHHPLTDETEIVTDLLGRLPFNQRAAVVLRYYVGYSTDEIATALGCPRGSVGPWIDRALTAMRKELP
jgi:RNA polymerase sigma factor (sigma-70 family)